MKQTLVAATVALAGHPSAPNYLELVGGSNFGVSDDYWPNWVNGGCIDNAPGSTGCNGAVTPIAVPGMDNPVVATATDPVKHDSFVYFQNIELGGQEGLTLNEVKDFDGPHGLWADLQTDDVPNLAVIV